MNSVSKGAKTSTGGEVLEGSSTIYLNGAFVSLVGHQATCKSGRKSCKGIGKIVSNVKFMIDFDGKQPAQAGDWVDCGCPPMSNVLLGDNLALTLGTDKGGYGSPVAPPIITRDSNQTALNNGSVDTWSNLFNPIEDTPMVAPSIIRPSTNAERSEDGKEVAILKSESLNSHDTLHAIAKGQGSPLKKGSKGEDVKAIQGALLIMGFNLGKAGDDGHFGALTEHSIKVFQDEFKPTHRIHPEYSINAIDGVVGKNTLLALDEATMENWVYGVEEKSTFKKYYYNKLLRHEGGYVNDPDDLGGATNKGITFSTLKQHSNSILGLPATMDLLKGLTDKQAYLIYKNQYWDKINGDEILDIELAFQIFDFHMNAGKYGIKTLQECLNNEFNKSLITDGFWGEKTLNAVNSVPVERLYVQYKTYRIAYYKKISVIRPQNKRFLQGWLNRANSFNSY